MLSLEPLYADMEGAGLGKQQWGLLDEGFSWDVTVHSETGLGKQETSIPDYSCVKQLVKLCTKFATSACSPDAIIKFAI